MRFFWIILICFVCPCVALAQNGVITGKVVNANGKSAIANASVFLSNATFGTSTNSDGSFTLSGVKPGQYELVVTVVGYEDYSKTVLVGHTPISLNIELNQKILMLREVVISTAADWKKKLRTVPQRFYRQYR